MNPATENEFLFFLDEVKRYSPGIHFLNQGAHLEEIETFEAQTDIRLPQQYKDFLQLHNGGELFRPGTVLAMLHTAADMVKQQGLPYLNDSFDSKHRLAGMPSNLIIIAEMNYGDLICIELSKENPDESNIVQWSYEECDISRRWHDFKEWLADAMDEGRMLIDYDGTEK
jgi:cell wall assembly regulator SMI1